MKNVLTKIDGMSFAAKKKVAGVLAGVLLNASSMTMLSAFAAPATSSQGTGEVDLSTVTTPIEGLLKSVLNVAIGLVAAVGAIYCVLLGVKLAKAEEPQEREKAKQHLKNAIIGFVLIFVLIMALRVGTPIMSKWLSQNS